MKTRAILNYRCNCSNLEPKRSEQLSRLLRYLVERHLEGLDGELKESVIGCEVFGRKPDYNPKLDPIVLTEARRLRARINEYYAADGVSDPIVIEAPRGGYLPVISPVAPTVSGDNRTPATPRPWYGIGVGLAVLVLAIAACARFGPARTLEMLPDVKGVEESIDLFEQAIAKDRSFAAGYAGIAVG